MFYFTVPLIDAACAARVIPQGLPEDKGEQHMWICLQESADSFSCSFFAQDLLDFPNVRGLLTAHQCYTDGSGYMTYMALELVRVLLEVLWLYCITHSFSDLTDLFEPAGLIICVVIGIQVCLQDCR